MGLESAKPTVTQEMVRQQLTRILVDPLFRQSQRLSVLLRFLVEATLAGRESELKEFVIGAEAFQRGPDFDPQVDNIVRVSAARLRSRLAEYYLGSGSGDRVVIALARGGYVPTFSATGSRPKVQGNARSASSLTNAAVGREPELCRLREAFEAVSNGASQLFAITGEVGIGKTTLVNRFLSELRDGEPSAWVLHGRCSERLSRTEPFLPILECLEDLIQGRRGSDVRKLMESAAPAWLSRLEPSTRSPDNDHSAERFRRELVRFLKVLSETCPVVMFLDDLHWVDESTVDLLAYISSHLENLRLLLLSAFRQSAVISAHPFISLKLALERRGDCREVPVVSLSPADVANYVSWLFPCHQFSSAFTAAVYERTEGHPLFMCDMLRFLLDQEIVVQRDGNWQFTGGVSEIHSLIPSGVQNMIRLESAKIADRDRKILECAAVQGVQFSSDIVSKALTIDAAETEERLGQLAVVHHFIEASGESSALGRAISVPFRFVHVLYQNALYAEIAPSRRVSLSLSVAAALVDSGAGTASRGAAEIALLFEGGRDNDRASQYFLLASRQAISVFAYPEAVLLCRRGLDNLTLTSESTGRDARELEFLLILGLALMVTCGYAAPEVETVHRRSRELCLGLGNQRHLMRVLWGIHTCLVNAGELIRALELAEEMRDLALSRTDTDSQVQSLHAHGTSLAFMGRVAEACDALEKAVSLAESTELKSRRFHYVLDMHVTVMSMLARASARLGRLDGAIEKARRSLDIAGNLEHPPSIAYATFWVGWTVHARGEFAQACGPLEVAMDLSRKHGLPQFLEWSRILHGSCLANLGRLGEGIAEMRLSLENQLSMRSMLERPFCLTLLAEALISAGANEEALKCCDEALEISQRTGAKSYEAETMQIRERALAKAKSKAEFRNYLSSRHRSGIRSS